MKEKERSRNCQIERREGLINVESWARKKRTPMGNVGKSEKSLKFCKE